MDASLGNLFGKFHPHYCSRCLHTSLLVSRLCVFQLIQFRLTHMGVSLGLFTGAWASTPLKKMALPSIVAVKFQWLLREEYYLADSSPSMMECWQAWFCAGNHSWWIFWEPQPCHVWETALVSPSPLTSFCALFHDVLLALKRVGTCVLYMLGALRGQKSCSQLWACVCAASRTWVVREGGQCSSPGSHLPRPRFLTCVSS